MIAGDNLRSLISVRLAQTILQLAVVKMRTDVLSQCETMHRDEGERQELRGGLEPSPESAPHAAFPRTASEGHTAKAGLLILRRAEHATEHTRRVTILE